MTSPAPESSTRQDDMVTNCPECADELDNRDTNKCEVCQLDGLCSRCLIEHDCEK